MKKEAKNTKSTKVNSNGSNQEPSFFDIINSISYNISLLAKYDSFGSTALAGVLSLLLSRSKDYVEQYNQNINQSNSDCAIPQEIQQNVDEIINKVKKNLK